MPIECPERFEFASYSDGLWGSIPEEAQLNINADDVAMKDYILQCEAAVKIHNKD